MLTKQADHNLHGTYIQLLPNKNFGGNASTRTIIVLAAPLIDEIDLLRLPLDRPDVEVQWSGAEQNGETKYEARDVPKLADDQINWLVDLAVVIRKSSSLANFREALRIPFAAWVLCNTVRLAIFWVATSQLVSYDSSTRSYLASHVDRFNQSPDC